LAKVALEDVLISTERPHVIQCVTDHEILFRQVGTLAGVRPRHIDLAGCATEHDLFGAFIRGLSMPYKQLNWNGFEEAINDLSWIDPGNINILVLHGTSLYRSNPNLFQQLVSILDLSGYQWAKPADLDKWRGHSPRPFHVIFVTEQKSDLPLQNFDFVTKSLHK